MPDLTLADLTDADLTRRLAALVAHDRFTLSLLLAHLAEFDARRLFLTAGYSSMFVYCVEALHFSEAETAKRILVARTARRFPALLSALAQGILHLTAIYLLAPHLTDENAGELIDAATHRRKTDIESYLARRFPQSLPRTTVAVTIRRIGQPASVPTAAASLFETSSDAPRFEVPPVGKNPSESVPERHNEHTLEYVPEPPSQPHPGTPANAPAVSSRTPPDLAAQVTQHETQPTVQPAPQAPIQLQQAAPERFLIRLTIEKGTHDKLREAQLLLSHAVAASDVGQVLDRALDALIVQLKKRKIGVPLAKERTTRSRKPPATRGRHIPATIRRTVWERDEGRCTFVSAEGHRCAERRFLEFDHVEPMALGGLTTPANLRLRCRAHNQHEAERTFGAAFIRRKRRERG